jgi:uroporphyrinogen-III decarboxylase
LEEFTHFSQEELEYFTNEAIKASKTQRAVIANYGGTALGDIALVPAPFLKYPKGIRDIEEWYMSTLIRQDFLHNIFDKQTEIAISNLEKLKEKISPLVDIIFICGTDFGTQNSTFCSVDTYRNLYLPYYKRMNDWIHRQTSWKTFKHSCGAIRPLISAFIESGFDIINPVQLSAKDMQAKELKEEFGKEIVFWGGGVDTQTTLAFAKPEDVRRQVLANLEIFSKDGGFIFNTVHNIQANTPLNNIIAMLNALNEFNGK